jgi:hypothetical protein
MRLQACLLLLIDLRLLTVLCPPLTPLRTALHVTVLLCICRGLFMTTMLNVITRLGLPGNSTLENRFLSVDIASTLFYWDHLAGQELGQSAGESAGPQVKAEAGAEGGEQSPPAAPPVPGAPAEAGGDVDQPARCVWLAWEVKQGSPSVFPGDWHGQQPHQLTKKYRLSAKLTSRWAACPGPLHPCLPACRTDASRLTPGMSEMIINFLLRMAFVRWVGKWGPVLCFVAFRSESAARSAGRLHMSHSAVGTASWLHMLQLGCHRPVLCMLLLLLWLQLRPSGPG